MEVSFAAIKGHVILLNSKHNYLRKKIGKVLGSVWRRPTEKRTPPSSGHSGNSLNLEEGERWLWVLFTNNTQLPIIVFYY